MQDIVTLESIGIAYDSLLRLSLLANFTGGGGGGGRGANRRETVYLYCYLL